MLCAADLRDPDHRKGARTEKAAQISLALLGDIAKPLFAAARVLFWHEPDPCREVAARSKGLRIGDGRNQGRCERRSNSGDFVETPARLVRPVPGIDPPVKLQNLRFALEEQRSQSFDALTRNIGDAFVFGICNRTKQFFHPPLRPTGATIPSSAR